MRVDQVGECRPDTFQFPGGEADLRVQDRDGGRDAARLAWPARPLEQHDRVAGTDRRARVASRRRAGRSVAQPPDEPARAGKIALGKC
jgi:hypothetical protein